MRDENLLRPVVEPGDQSIFVAADVEYRSLANLIGATEIGPQFRKVLPSCPASDGEPIR
jgi:hypothetical protein